jgi:hypothetical protein
LLSDATTWSSICNSSAVIGAIWSASFLSMCAYDLNL